MRRSQWYLVPIAIAALLLGQACALTPTAPATPTAPGSPVAATPGTGGAAETPTLSPTRGATAAIAPTAVSTRPGPTPTEPRLGLNPPASPNASPTRAAATPVIAGRPARIMEIQGKGARSPLLSQTVRTAGTVTASYQSAPAKAFFMQDANGDGDPETSDGLFVYQGDRVIPGVKVGDIVTVVGVVREFNGRTQLDISQAGSAVIVESSGNRLPEPVELQPPAANAEALAYYERLEAMLVRVSQAVVVGPTSRFGEFTVVREDSGRQRIFQNDPRGTGERIVVDDEGGQGARYEVAVGDRVSGLIGPLDYSFGQYKIEQLPEARLLVTPGERVVQPPPPAAPGEFTVASFNVENLFDPIYTPGKLGPCDRDENGNPCRERITPADYAHKLTKVALAIRDGLGAPTLVAIQEAENIDVLTALAATPELAPFGYGAVLLEGIDPRGINVGLLYRQDRVTVEAVSQRNACTTKNYGFSEVEQRCSSKNDGNLDGYYLAARPPLIVTLTVRSDDTARQLTLVINHFKSKGGVDPEGKGFVSRRADEARLVAGIVNELLAADPNAAVIVLGDLNDFVESEPLRILTTTAPLHNLALQLPEDERYSYIFNGESEILDHILVTPGLLTRLVGFTYAHFDADFPYSRAADPTLHRASDHDPPVARFRLRD